MFRALAQLTYRRHWPIIIAAIVFVVVAGVVGGPVAALLRGGGFDDPGSQSVAAQTRLEMASGIKQSENLVALINTGQPVTSPTTRAEVAKVATAIQASPTIAHVVTPYATHDPGMVSRDGKLTYVVGEFKSPVSDEDAETAALALRKDLASDHRVTLGGGAIASKEIGTTVSQDLGRAELLAFPILFVLLLLVFRGLVAAFFPLLIGIFTILGAFLGIRIVDAAMWLSVYALDLIIGLGLGLSIDYSLLITSRYREEFARSRSSLEALQRTLASAGRTVLFSSLTVTAALASLLVFPQRFLVSMGIGGILATIMAATGALLLLPAVLALLGERVNALAPRRWQWRPPTPGTGFWHRLSRQVMSHAGPIAAGTAILLILLGIPFLRIKFTSVDASVLPKSTATRQVYDALQARFPANHSTPITLAIAAPIDPTANIQLQRYAARLRTLSGAASVLSPHPIGAGTWEIDVTPSTDVFSQSSRDLVEKIRSIPAPSGARPYSVLVGGATAAFLDQRASLNARLPLALAIIAFVTFIVLFLVTGSVILAIKSLVMNLLSLSATFGILVLIFQDGRLESLLGYTSQGALEATQPILLFALAFGLSTDYSVFLLSRIKEVLDSGANNAEAVAGGMERTGRIVTAAAVLFCVAIGAFVTSNIVFIKELGLGTALAVLIDASIVRALLVPSLMQLLGRWNWWAPPVMARLQRRIRIEEAGLETAQKTPPLQHV